jgi:hypothetical protein
MHRRILWKARPRRRRSSGNTHKGQVLERSKSDPVTLRAPTAAAVYGPSPSSSRRPSSGVPGDHRAALLKLRRSDPTMVVASATLVSSSSAVPAQRPRSRIDTAAVLCGSSDRPYINLAANATKAPPTWQGEAKNTHSALAHCLSIARDPSH